MVQTKEPQLVLPEGFTVAQVLWSCPTTHDRGDQRQHRAAALGWKGDIKQVSPAMPKAAVSIHPHGLWSLESAAQGHNPVPEAPLTSSYQCKQDTGDSNSGFDS